MVYVIYVGVVAAALYVWWTVELVRYLRQRRRFKAQEAINAEFWALVAPLVAEFGDKYAAVVDEYFRSLPTAEDES